MLSKPCVLVAVLALFGLLTTFALSVAATGDEAASATKPLSVVLDGKPLAAGKITFYRKDGQFVGSKIEDGKWTIDHLLVGVLQVTIEGKGVPKKYTSETTSPLRVEVKDNIFLFDLKTERDKPFRIGY